MNNNEIVLSVIVPNFNKEAYIEECINSILHQTYTLFELIIIDDCSTDNSKHIITKLSEVDSRIKTIFLTENKGVSNARNVGVKNSSGRYITFIDSDDVYLNKDKLKNEMKLIQLYNNKGQDIIAYSQDINMDKDGKVIGRKCPGVLMPRSEILTDAVSGFRASKAPRDYVLKKDLLIRVGGYSFPINYFEDLDLRIRLAMESKFVYTYEIGTGYRVVGDGLSSGHSINEAIHASDSIRKQYYPLLPFYKKITVEIKKLLRYILFYCSMLLKKVK